MARKRKAATTKRKSASRLDLHTEARAVGKRLDQLTKEAKQLEQQARVRITRQLRLLKRKQNAANRALAKLGRQGAAASEPIIAGLQRAWHDMELAVRRGAKRFRETT